MIPPEANLQMRKRLNGESPLATPVKSQGGGGRGGRGATERARNWRRTDKRNRSSLEDWADLVIYHIHG